MLVCALPMSIWPQAISNGRPSSASVLVRPVMDVQRVAEAVVYMAGLPPEANVLFMTVMATKMPFVGRG